MLTNIDKIIPLKVLAIIKIEISAIFLIKVALSNELSWFRRENTWSISQFRQST